jgi:folate-binding protein YgfZ
VNGSGDLAWELEALRHGAAVAPAPAADRLELVGADARRFLNGYVTADVANLANDGVARGYLTDGKGHVLADFDLATAGDRLVLRLPAERGAAIREHLARYQLAARVELAAPAALGRVVLRGAGAAAVLAATGAPEPGRGRCVAAELGGVAVEVLALERPGGPRFELWPRTPAGAPALVAALVAAGANAVSAAALEVARVEDGELAFGVDYGEDAFPQELGDPGAVSFTKGCYLGQEVVARIHYRGGVQRRSSGLRFGSGPPAPGAALLFDGREVGRVGSVARSPRHGAIGLALIHRRAGEPPVELALEGGGTATAVALPFTTAAAPVRP